MRNAEPLQPLEVPGQTSVQMAGLVSARFRRGMWPLAIGTALCVAFSAPLADFLLERHDLAARAQRQAEDLARQIATLTTNAPAWRTDPRQEIARLLGQVLQQRGAEEIVTIALFDQEGRTRQLLNGKEESWPLVLGSASIAGLGEVRVALCEPEWVGRDLLLLGIFGGLGLLLGLALYFFPLRLFREEELVLLFARQSVAAAEDERLRLSRDLHDGLGQTLGTAAVALVRLNARIGATPEAAETARLIDGALDEVRHIALGLRPPTLVDLGLNAALSSLARDAERTGLRADVTIEELPPLDAELELACFRLVQEGLSNIVRHAQAKGFKLTIARKDGALTIELIDDGRGFAGPSGMGLGLVGARERAARLAGNFTIESTLGAGTTIRARLPLPAGTP